MKRNHFSQNEKRSRVAPHAHRQLVSWFVELATGGVLHHLVEQPVKVAVGARLSIPDSRFAAFATPNKADVAW